MPRPFYTYSILAISFLILLPGVLFAQPSYRRQQNEVLAVNIISNGIMGGVGGVIHKKKGEKWFPVFLRNFGKGCLGGLVKFSAKSQLYYVDNRTTYLVPFNRLYYYLGHSIVMNAAQDKKLLQTYYCNMWGMDIRIHGKNAEEGRFQVRASLGTIAYATRFAIIGHRLDLYRTLEFGEAYFVMKDHYKIPGYTGELMGIAGYNTLAVHHYTDNTGVDFPVSGVISHELVHTLQHTDYAPLALWYQPQLEEKYKKHKVYRELSRYVNADFESLIFFTAAYGLQPQPLYYKNWFEFEAEHFATRQYLQR